MGDLSPLIYIGWIDDRKYSDPVDKTETAICEHPGCPWSSPSTATSEQAQIAAFLAHHANNHQD